MMKANLKNPVRNLDSQLIIVLIAVFFGISLVISGCDQTQHDVFEEIADSHINANVPEAEKFGEILERDLKSYMKNVFKQDFMIEPQLLRKGPTQVGVALPKYYLWITAKDNEEKVIEGAMRIAAIDKVRFQVTHFVTIDEIRSKPDIIDAIFPPPVCERIMTIVSEKS